MDDEMGWNNGCPQIVREKISHTLKLNQAGFKKGYTPWNKGKIGVKCGIPKGRKNPEHSKFMKDYYKNHIHPRKGKLISKEQIEILRKCNLGRIPWNKGIKQTQEFKDKIRNITLKQMENSEHRKRLSEIRKKGLAEGRIKKMIGKEHPMYGKTGEKSPLWLGGKSFEPYDVKFNKEFKSLVRFRDNFCCLNCGMSEQKHLILIGRKLHIHHIDYNKLNTCLINCCALCVGCNLKANYNREYWTKLFQEKLSKLYNHKYNNKVIIQG